MFRPKQRAVATVALVATLVDGFAHCLEGAAGPSGSAATATADGDAGRKRTAEAAPPSSTSANVEAPKKYNLSPSSKHNSQVYGSVNDGSVGRSRSTSQNDGSMGRSRSTSQNDGSMGRSRSNTPSDGNLLCSSNNSKCNPQNYGSLTGSSSSPNDGNSTGSRSNSSRNPQNFGSLTGSSDNSQDDGHSTNSRNNGGDNSPDDESTDSSSDQSLRHYVPNYGMRDSEICFEINGVVDHMIDLAKKHCDGSYAPLLWDLWYGNDDKSLGLENKAHEPRKLARFVKKVWKYALEYNDPVTFTYEDSEDAEDMVRLTFEQCHRRVRIGTGGDEDNFVDLVREIQASVTCFLLTLDMLGGTRRALTTVKEPVFGINHVDYGSSYATVDLEVQLQFNVERKALEKMRTVLERLSGQENIKWELSREESDKIYSDRSATLAKADEVTWDFLEELWATADDDY